MTYEAWNEMEEGDEIQIGVINENSRINGKEQDGSEENSDQSEVIVNSKSSVDTVEKRKFNFVRFWMHAKYIHISIS